MRICSWVTLCSILMLVTTCWSEFEKSVTPTESRRPILRKCQQTYLCFNTTPIYDAATLTCRCKYYAHRRYTNKGDDGMYTVTSQPRPTGRDCYTMSGRFHFYRGTRNVTRTGLSCRPWTELEGDVTFLTGETKQEAGNYCRIRKDSGDLVSFPWCHVSTTKRWEYCDIEACGSFQGNDCFSITEREGKDTIVYKGTTSTTISGYTCKPWQSRGKRFTSGENAIEAANFCRVVVGDREVVPWCYYTDDDDWEVCNVRLCSGRHKYIL